MNCGLLIYFTKGKIKYSGERGTMQVVFLLLSWNLMVDLISITLVPTSSPGFNTEGNLPALLRPGPNKRGILRIRVDEARKAERGEAKRIEATRSEAKRSEAKRREAKRSKAGPKATHKKGKAARNDKRSETRGGEGSVKEVLVCRVGA